MGGGQSRDREKDRDEDIKSKVAARENLVNQLQKKVESLDIMLQNSRQTVVELSEQVASLQTQLREAQEAQDAAIEQKKEWQMQAASIHAKMEKYRDRYELMLEKYKEEHTRKMKTELAVELSKQEIVWRDQLRKEREMRTTYERILLSINYSPGANSSIMMTTNTSPFTRHTKLTPQEAALGLPLNTAANPLLPLDGYPETFQFYTLKTDITDMPAIPSPGKEVPAESVPALAPSPSKPLDNITVDATTSFTSMAPGAVSGKQEASSPINSPPGTSVMSLPPRTESKPGNAFSFLTSVMKRG